MDAKAHIYTARALGRGRVVNPTLGRFYPWYSFYMWLSGPQDQYGHKGAKKNLHPSDNHDRTWTGQPLELRGLHHL